MGRKKLTEAEREAMHERRARVLENVRRTRALAERAQAKLDAQRPGQPSWSAEVPTKLTKAERETERARVLANAQRTRELAERAQTRLDAQRSSE
jgi:hypothetical protein